MSKTRSSAPSSEPIGVPTDGGYVRLSVNGETMQASASQTLATLLMAQRLAARRSVSGEARTPFCGMGVCGECRVTVNGRLGVLACLTSCCEGLNVQTERTDPAARKATSA